MAKKPNETVEDIMKQQLSKLENSDKLARLERESNRDKKIIQELKEREKVSARALVLFERKIKHLKETLMLELLKLCKASEAAELLAEDYEDDELVKIIEESNAKLYELCNNLEQLASISESDKAFILNKPVEVKKEDTQSRFDRLKENFNQKIGSSVLRKPGRPKKQDQSIVADIGLGKKVERVIDEKTETQNRLNEIFYGTPSQKSTMVSTIPNTADSAFDFAEALNPNNSLQDIMSDIMSDMSRDKQVVYSKDNLDKHLSRLDDNELKDLEAGIISKPHFHSQVQNLENFEEGKKDKISHKNGILTGNKLFEDIKK